MNRGRHKYRAVMQYRHELPGRFRPALTVERTVHVRANNIRAARLIAGHRFEDAFGVRPTSLRLERK